MKVFILALDGTRVNKEGEINLPILASTGSGIHSSPSDSESERSTMSTGIGSLAISSWKKKIQCITSWKTTRDSLRKSQEIMVPSSLALKNEDVSRSDYLILPLINQYHFLDQLDL